MAASMVKLPSEEILNLLEMYGGLEFWPEVVPDSRTHEEMTEKQLADQESKRPEAQRQIWPGHRPSIASRQLFPDVFTIIPNKQYPRAELITTAAGIIAALKLQPTTEVVPVVTMTVTAIKDLLETPLSLEGAFYHKTDAPGATAEVLVIAMFRAIKVRRVVWETIRGFVPEMRRRGRFEWLKREIKLEVECLYRDGRELMLHLPSSRITAVLTGIFAIAQGYRAHENV
ncbi:hypothetical protein S40293_10757 [Stachybotrys chartarum IBT 40293]|nr:hypothetical protein S40293_10757 [Stachybotrys chartarum IBT 40293]